MALYRHWFEDSYQLPLENISTFKVSLLRLSLLKLPRCVILTPLLCPELHSGVSSGSGTWCQVVF